MASHHRISKCAGFLIVEHILTLVNSGGMVRLVRQGDASPAATEGLAAVAVGTEQIRLSSLLFGGGTKCGQSGTAKTSGFERDLERRGELTEVAGSGWQLLRAGTPPVHRGSPSTVA